jgi:hypothetical protein
MSRTAPLSSVENARLYRRRRRERGVEEVLFQLPGHAVAIIDAIKERHGLRNRSQALLQLIEQRGATAQHVN